MTSTPANWLTLIAGILLAASIASSASAQDDSWAPDQPLGSILPTFTLPDSEGQPREILGLSGSQGMLLLFNRSTDW